MAELNAYGTLNMEGIYVTGEYYFWEYLYYEDNYLRIGYE